MKQLLTISAIFISLNVFGQRDTLDYNLAVDYDTITHEIDGSDTTITYQKNINQNEYLNIYRQTNTFNYLDSLLISKEAEIQSLGITVEAIYSEYQRQNTILWNLKKEFARLEDIIDEIYVP